MMYYRGLFLLKDDLQVHCGDLCLVRSPRGTELGKVLSAPKEYEGEVLWLKNSKTHGEMPKIEKDVLHLSGEILRIATEEDMDKVQKRFAQGTREEEFFCKERIKANNMPMKLAGVEYLFEGEKIIFYFLADGRVDFRELVKDLAKKYRTRIEMKQIGVRDEARLLAEYEHCGRRLCCKGFLNSLEPVTMKMAKSQKTTLDPSKISGRCGRLMCCLRYEHQVYQVLRGQLPKKGSTVYLKTGRARVLSHDILLQRLFVETENGVMQHVRLEEILPEAPAGAEGNRRRSGAERRPRDERRRGSRSRRSGRGSKLRDENRQPSREASRSPGREGSSRVRSQEKEKGPKQQNDNKSREIDPPKPTKSRKHKHK
jgi:cell fate regulator YaaT (PSP1 superfamily)